MTFIVDGSLGGTFPTWTTATRPATPATGQEGFNTTTGVLEVYNGSAWFAAGTITANVTTYTSGSGTYTTPTGAKYLFVRMVAGGGGGQGGSSTSGTNTSGGTGGSSTFGASLTVTGGGSGTSGGSATGGDVNIAGGPSAYPINYASSTGANGGNSPFGGGGGGVYAQNAGYPGTTNTGGGGGGGCGFAAIGGWSGAAGGYLEKTISSPSSTYSYAVGAGGTAGAGGTSAGAGGVGGSGIIIVTAYF